MGTPTQAYQEPPAKSPGEWSDKDLAALHELLRLRADAYDKGEWSRYKLLKRAITALKEAHGERYESYRGATDGLGQD